MPTFQKKPEKVHAVRMEKSFEIGDANGIVRGKPGDWLIKTRNEIQSIYSDEEFRKKFEPIDDRGRKAMGLETPDAK